MSPDVVENTKAILKSRRCLEEIGGIILARTKFKVSSFRWWTWHNVIGIALWIFWVIMIGAHSTFIGEYFFEVGDNLRIHYLIYSNSLKC